MKIPLLTTVIAGVLAHHCKDIAEILLPKQNRKNLYVISYFFLHFFLGFGIQMDLVNSLLQPEFLSLREHFKDGLKQHQFFDVIQCVVKPLIQQGRLPQDTRWQQEGELSRVYHELDLAGKGYVTWEDFTSSLVDASTQLYNHDVATVDGLRHSFHTNLRFPNQSEEIRRVCFLPAMRRYVACGINQSLTLHDQKTFMCVSSFKLKCVMLDTCYVVRSHMLVVSTFDQSLLFFDIGTQDRKRELLDPIMSHGAEDSNDADANKLLVRRIVIFDKTQTRVFYDEKLHVVYSSDRVGVVSMLSVDQIRNCSTEARNIPIPAANIILNELRWHSSGLTSILSVDTSLVSSSLDNTIAIHERGRPWIETRSYTNTHKSLVRGLAYNESHGLLVSVGDDPTPKCCVLSLAKISATFAFRDEHDPHRHPILNVFSLKNSPYVVTADSDATFKVWDLRTYRCTQNINYPTHARGTPAMTDFTLSESTQRFVGSGRRLVVLQYAQQELHVRAHTAYVRGMHVSHNSLVTWSIDDVKTWSCADGTMKKCIKPDLDIGEEITAFCLDDTEIRFFIGTSFGKVQCLRLHSGNVQFELHKQDHEITSIAYLPCVGQSKLKVIITADARGHVKSWNELDGRDFMDHLTPSTACLTTEIDVVLNRQAQRMYLVCDDRWLHVIDVSLATAPHICTQHRDISMLSVVSLDDLGLLAVLHSHGSVHLWYQCSLEDFCILPLDDNTLVTEGNEDKGKSRKPICKIMYSSTPTHRLLLCGDRGGTITIWDMGNLRPPTTPESFGKIVSFSTGSAPIAGMQYIPPTEDCPLELIAVRFSSQSTVDVFTMRGTRCGTLSEQRLSDNHPSARVHNANQPPFKSPASLREMELQNSVGGKNPSQKILTTKQPTAPKKPNITQEEHRDKLRRKKHRHKYKPEHVERKAKIAQMWREQIPTFLKELIIEEKRPVLSGAGGGTGLIKAISPHLSLPAIPGLTSRVLDHTVTQRQRNAAPASILPKVSRAVKSRPVSAQDEEEGSVGVPLTSRVPPRNPFPPIEGPIDAPLTSRPLLRPRHTVSLVENIVIVKK